MRFRVLGCTQCGKDIYKLSYQKIESGRKIMPPISYWICPECDIIYKAKLIRTKPQEVLAV